VHAELREDESWSFTFGWEQLKVSMKNPRRLLFVSQTLVFLLVLSGCGSFHRSPQVQQPAPRARLSTGYAFAVLIDGDEKNVAKLRLIKT